MTKLRSLSNKDLKALEADLEKIRVGIHVLNVTHVGSLWHVHFLIQDAQTQDVNKRFDSFKEPSLSTKDLKK